MWGVLAAAGAGWWPLVPGEMGWDRGQGLAQSAAGGLHPPALCPHAQLCWPGERPPQGMEPPKQDGAQGTAPGGTQMAPSSSSRGLQGAGGAPLAPRVLRRAGEEAVFALAAGLCLHTDTSAPGPGTEPAAKLFQR